MTPEQLQQSLAKLAGLDARLAAVEGDRGVRNVLARYMKLCDQPCCDQAFPQLADLFTEEAVWEGVGAQYSQTFGRRSGRAAIAAFLGGYLAPASSHFKMNAHFLSSDQVAVDGARARGEWTMLQASTYQDDSCELIAARLNINFMQQDQVWQISHFRTERLFCVPWNQQVANLFGAVNSANAAANSPFKTATSAVLQGEE
ncbi:nuclear transport factor 2 family protein [Herbaspirillum lusitanum]|uniref:Nuclear transport factor 2 family protein n=1 Tax=Herbaspirillum lusitanum TaxID=213312 RepID=A0ABW9AD97_9BURK